MNRRDLLHLTCVAVAGTVAGCTSSSGESTGSPAGTDQRTPTAGEEGGGTPADWPMAEVDAGNTAALRDASGPAEPVERRWQFAGAGGYETAPAVVDEMVYATTDGGRVYALAARDGTERWHVDAGREPLGPPAVTGGRVYAVAAGRLVRAWATDTGVPEWEFEMDRRDDRLDWVESAPTVANGTVYVGGTDGHLHAIDAATGRERWQTRQEGPVPLTPAVGDGAVFAGAADGGSLVALDRGDGTERWRSEFRVPDREVTVEADPTVADDTVYTGVHADDPTVTHTASGRVYALAARDGAERWHVETAAPVQECATDGETLYVATAEPSHLPHGTLLALDATDGTERWRLQPEEGVHGRLALVGDQLSTVLVVGYPAESHLRALDPADGSVRWTHPLGFSPSGTAVVDGAVFVGGEAAVHVLE